MNLLRVCRALALSVPLALFSHSCGGKPPSGGSDDCPGFSKIVSGGFSRVGDHLTWTLELESMPAELVLNRAAVPDNMVDYGWQINVDADVDGIYEVYMSIAHYKMPGAPETRSSDILGNTNHDIFKYSSDADTALPLGTFQAGIEGNAFTFDIDITQISSFSSVASASQSQWTVAYRYGALTRVCTDRWP